MDTALAAVDVAAIVYTVRNTFARRHALAEARRHLQETLRGRAFPPGLDEDIADRALTRHGRQLTVSRKDRRAPAPDQLTYTADFAWPARWWIAGTDGEPPRASTRYERARVASRALQNAIRTARTAPAARDEAPTATASTAAHAHQQAAMPELPEGRTTDPATWMRTPENLDRLAAITRQADGRRRAMEDRKLQAPAADPAIPYRQEHEQHQQPGNGLAPGARR